MIIDAYSQKFDQGPNWGGGGGGRRDKESIYFCYFFFFFFFFDMIIFNELKTNSRIIKMMQPTVLRIFSPKSKSDTLDTLKHTIGGKCTK